MQTTDPLMFTFEFMSINNTAAYSHINHLMQHTDYLTRDREELCSQLRETPPERTKLRLYLRMNPQLVVHPLYHRKESNGVIEDNLRISFTRVRLCSHRLRSETGRWFGVPADQRLCQHCHDAVQDEHHILRCPSTQSICAKYGVSTTDLIDLLTDPSKSDLICLKECVKHLQSNKEL